MSENRFESFIEKFLETGGEFSPSFSLVLKNNSFKDVAVSSTLRELIKANVIGFNLVSPPEAEVSLTVADAAVIETGSLIFGYETEEDFLLISLPKVHVVLVKEESIYDTLAEALRSINGAYVSIVTGPSKTGDIELIHVYGVHGPERVIVVREI